MLVAQAATTGAHPKQIKGWAPVFYPRAAPTPTAIETRFSLTGGIYTSREGMVLYIFICEEGPESVPCDDPGDAATHRAILCGAPDVCAQCWRPYRAETDAGLLESGR